MFEYSDFFRRSIYLQTAKIVLASVYVFTVLSAFVKPILLRWLVLLTGIYLLQPSLRAQDDGGTEPTIDPSAPLAVAIDFGGNSVRHPGRRSRKFEQVAIDPHRVVTVSVQYPVGMAGQGIITESLDGGRIIVRGESLAIDKRGMLIFAFQAGDLIGFSRITLYNGETMQTLQFWVNDLAHPDQNPQTTPGL